MAKERRTLPSEAEVMEVMGRVLFLDTSKLKAETRLEEQDKPRCYKLALVLNDELGSELKINHVQRWKKLGDIVTSVRSSMRPPKSSRKGSRRSR